MLPIDAHQAKMVVFPDDPCNGFIRAEDYSFLLFKRKALGDEVPLEEDPSLQRGEIVEIDYRKILRVRQSLKRRNDPVTVLFLKLRRAACREKDRLSGSAPGGHGWK